MPTLKIDPVEKSEKRILEFMTAYDIDSATKEVLKLMNLSPRKRKKWENAAKSVGAKDISGFITSVLAKMYADSLSGSQAPCRPYSSRKPSKQFLAKTL